MWNRPGTDPWSLTPDPLRLCRIRLLQALAAMILVLAATVATAEGNDPERVAFLQETTLARPDPSRNRLENIELSTDGSRCHLELTFRDPLEKTLLEDALKDVEYHRGYLQLKISGTRVNPPIRHFRIDHPLVREAFVQQYTEDLVRVRLTLAEGTEEEVLRDLVHLDRTPRGVTIAVDTPQSTKGSRGGVHPRPPDADSRSEGTHPPMKNAGGSASMLSIIGTIIEPLVKPKATTSGEGQSDRGDMSLGGESPSSADQSDAAVVAEAPAKDAAEDAAGEGGPAIGPLGGGSREPAALTTAKDFNFFSAFARMIVSLGVVIMILLAASMGAKRLFSRTKVLGGERTAMMKVRGTHYLGPKKQIVVMEVADEMLVLGVSNENISFLTKLGGRDEASSLSENVSGTSLAPFEDHLEACKTHGDGAGEPSSVASAVKMLQSRLGKVRQAAVR